MTAPPECKCRFFMFVIASANIVVAQLKETIIIIIIIRKGQFARLATCRCGASAVLSSIAKSVVGDEKHSRITGMAHKGL